MTSSRGSRRAARQSADGYGRGPSAQKSHGVLAVFVVGLVCHQQHGCRIRRRQVGQRFVVSVTPLWHRRGTARLGGLDRSLDRRRNFASRSLPQATSRGVDRGNERRPVGLVSLRSRVTPGRSRRLPPVTDDPVDSGLLPRFGRDETDGGQRHDAGSSALRSEMPSVAIPRPSWELVDVVPSESDLRTGRTFGRRNRWPWVLLQDAGRSRPTINPGTACCHQENVRYGMIMSGTLSLWTSGETPAPNSR